MSEFINTKVAAGICGVTKNTIQNLCKRGVLTHQLKGKWYMVDRDEVEAYKDKIAKVYKANVDIDAYLASREIELARLREEREAIVDAREQLEQYPRRASRAFFLLECFLKKYESFDFTEKELSILRKYIEGKPLVSIADDMGVSRQQVGVLFERALAKIKYIESNEKRLARKIEALNEKVEELETQNLLLKAKKTAEMATSTRLLINRPIDEECVTVRLMNVCKKYDIKTIGELASQEPDFLAKCKNCGRKTIVEARELLDKYNLSFGMTMDEIIKKIKNA